LDKEIALRSPAEARYFSLL